MSDSVRCGPDRFESIGIRDVPPSWLEPWPPQGAEDGVDPPFFLKPGFVEEAAEKLSTSATNRDALVEARDALLSQPFLAGLASHLHHLLFVERRDSDVARWPEIGGQAGSLFYAVVLLSGIPSLLTRNRAEGIPDAVTYHTATEMEYWIDERVRIDGRLGLKPTPWLVDIFSGTVFRLGRLQFMPGRFAAPFRAYRHISGRPVVLFPEDGLEIRGDGQFADCEDGKKPWDVWQSRLTVTTREICGNPVDPRGYVTRQTRVLDASEWEPVLERDDSTIAVHIPGAEPMRFDDCGKAFALACDFFQRYFPDLGSRAFTCVSWLVDPEFDAILPADSNIAAFLREWYLHPYPETDGSQTYYRIFGSTEPPPNLSSLPAETSLQRAVAAHLQTGGVVHDGAAILFAQDLAWGSQVYRSQADGATV